MLGGQKIALTVEDSAANKDQAINAARKLIGRDKVVLVIGPTLSNEMFAVGPVTNERKIPTIGTSTTAAGITDIGPLHLPHLAAGIGRDAGDAARRRRRAGCKTIALMYANDDAFSKSGFDVMKAAAREGSA